ncbi:MAG TPA: glycosyltransferase 87 family protein [Mycobacteriales bacterium]|nr:glycosyltransferase 87 family protein [Mycobacteriales bacterium]
MTPSATYRVTVPSWLGRASSDERVAVWAWLLSRLLGLLVLSGSTFYPLVDSDVVNRYYPWAKLLQAGLLPWRDYAVEYPPGALPFMTLPGRFGEFEFQFVLLAFVADAFIARTLWRARPGAAGAWLWIVLPILLGPLEWVRLDIFVAAAMVGYIRAIELRRWRAAGLCLAAATLLKLWPLALLVVMWRLLDRSGRWRIATWALFGTAALTVPVLAWGGAGGLRDMLRFQGGRGLEFESVWAFPYEVAHRFRLSSQWLQQGYGSIDVRAAHLVAYCIGFVLPAALLAVWFICWRSGPHARITVRGAALLLIAALLVSERVLSAQYVVWAVAVVALVAGEASTHSVKERTWLLGAAAAWAASSQLVYPGLFVSLLSGGIAGFLAACVHVVCFLAWVVVAVRYALRYRRVPPHAPAPATALAPA